MVQRVPRFSPLLLAVLLFAACSAIGAAVRLPDPIKDVPATAGTPGRAVFAGGCFWGVEAVFERLTGVSQAVSGYAGGSKGSARYDLVSIGTTGHAESVEVTYDPSAITYGQLLKVFFSVVHDPTQLNRQGPDHGPQYRSSIFYVNDDQKQVALAYVQQLDAANVFRRPIVTKVVALDAFYPAEAYHQNFLDRNPTYPYIVYNDLPKLEDLKKEFPELLKGKKTK